MNVFICVALFFFFKIFSFSDIISMENSPAEFIWSLELAREADQGLPPDLLTEMISGEFVTFDPARYQEIREGDLVWVHSCNLQAFAINVLPKIKSSFFLLINNSDDTFPTDTLKKYEIPGLLESEKILHFFAQNADCVKLSARVTPIPVGFDFHSLEWKKHQTHVEQESVLKNILLDLKPINERINKAFIDFHHMDTLQSGNARRYLETGETRASIFQQLVLTGLVDYSKERLPRSILWETKGRYAFSISPHANGLDCIRTWEDLTLGCIVIVKTSVLDPLYEGLPVVIVKNWSEITPSNLDMWLQKYSNAFTNPAYREKITSEYWKKKIRSKMKGILDQRDIETISFDVHKIESLDVSKEE